MFRKIVMKDKETLGILESSRTSPQSMLISVHRSRIIEVICTALYTLHSSNISLCLTARMCQIICLKICGTRAWRLVSWRDMRQGGYAAGKREQGRLENACDSLPLYKMMVTKWNLAEDEYICHNSLKNHAVILMMCVCKRNRNDVIVSIML